MDLNKINLSDRIKKLRKISGLSQKDLGEKFGLKKQIISYYETGKREPNLNLLIQLADFFNVSIDYLLGRDKDFKAIHQNKIDQLEVKIKELKKALNVFLED